MTIEIDTAGISSVLVLLTLANGAPVAAKRLLGRCLEQPVDCGLTLQDGRRLFGPSKTFRGLAAAVLSCSLGASLLGIDLVLGAAFGVTAMAGDLLSSFAKRRLGIPSSGRAVGLDQIPEALLPTLVISEPAALSAVDILIIVATFWGMSAAISPLFYWIGLRDRPY